MDPVRLSLDQPVLRVADTVVTLGMALAGAGAAVVLLLLFVFLLARGSARRRAVAAEQAGAEAAARAAETEGRLSEILRTQAEMQGRMATIAEVFSTRQSEVNRSINERLDGLTQKLGNTITEQTKSTHENLAKLQERLAVIDTAQNNIQALAKDVVGLQAILANKQTRGAFGQGRMEAIIADALPASAYAFQATLSNGSRPDCVIHMPNNAPSLVIDAKFPLEAWSALRDAEDPEVQKQKAQQFRRDVEVHVRDIADKYLVSGETQDTAFMFVPSESIFAELHENFESSVQKALRARVVIVSPSLLLLSLQVVQALLKDARMREQAHLIQHEVVRLLEDLTRLDDRVHKLQGHFNQTQRDIDQILVSTDKVTKRGARIESMEIEAEVGGANRAGQGESSRPVTVPEHTGQLKLHVTGTK
jgi:DNA recombination protein RmuC